MTLEDLGAQLMATVATLTEAGAYRRVLSYPSSARQRPRRLAASNYSHRSARLSRAQTLGRWLTPAGWC